MENQKISIAIAATLALAALGGCSKNPCPEGSYTNPAHKLCIKLPAGMEFEKEEDRTGEKWLQFQTKDKGSPRMSLMVKSDPKALDSAKAFHTGFAKSAADKGDTVVATGKPTGVEDGSFIFVNYKNGVISQINYTIKDNGKVVECYSNTGTKDAQAVFDACKTLRVTK